MRLTSCWQTFVFLTSFWQNQLKIKFAELIDFFTKDEQLMYQNEVPINNIDMQMIDTDFCKSIVSLIGCQATAGVYNS